MKFLLLLPCIFPALDQLRDSSPEPILSGYMSLAENEYTSPWLCLMVSLEFCHINRVSGCIPEIQTRTRYRLPVLWKDFVRMCGVSYCRKRSQRGAPVKGGQVQSPNAKKPSYSLWLLQLPVGTFGQP